MNRIGAKSDSGEGGEDPGRFVLRDNGDNPSSAIKQIASGRFGVTAEYLNNCQEIESGWRRAPSRVKVASCPGSRSIARLPACGIPPLGDADPAAAASRYLFDRGSGPAIYDLKQINPDARVCVKLVAATGIGTIAAGVAKAKADTILISGHGGGTGASPQSSIKHAGLPWEMGLSEVHQVLTMNGLRDKVVLRTDGGLKTGRDIVMAAMLGADEYGIGTASLIAGLYHGAPVSFQHLPVGVCTQREDLRETPARLKRLFSCSRIWPKKCVRFLPPSVPQALLKLSAGLTADSGQPR